MRDKASTNVDRGKHCSPIEMMRELLFKVLFSHRDFLCKCHLRWGSLYPITLLSSQVIRNWGPGPPLLYWTHMERALFGPLSNWFKYFGRETHKREEDEEGIVPTSSEIMCWVLKFPISPSLYIKFHKTHLVVK